jgi:hypothetical protein
MVVIIPSWTISNTVGWSFVNRNAPPYINQRQCFSQSAYTYACEYVPNSSSKLSQILEIPLATIAKVRNKFYHWCSDHFSISVLVGISFSLLLELELVNWGNLCEQKSMNSALMRCGWRNISSMIRLGVLGFPFLRMPFSQERGTLLKIVFVYFRTRYPLDTTYLHFRTRHYKFPGSWERNPKLTPLNTTNIQSERSPCNLSHYSSFQPLSATRYQTTE